MDKWPQERIARWNRMALAGAILVYLALALAQLSLPGLHYDEAKEAGLNAMEMLLRQDVRAFRASGLQIGTLFLPLMVQDYIGALNVYLALPFLALAGVTIPGLRLLGVACGLATLAATWKAGQELGELAGFRPNLAGSVAAWLMAVSPSFVFWSRQGIFVTNVVVTLAVLAVWFGLRWWRTGQARYLYLLAIASGLGLWAKLLFAWVLGAAVGTAVLAWLVSKLGGGAGATGLSRSRWQHWPVAAGLFLAALSPLLLFNQQTGGTLASIFGNLGSSYYGVENAAFGANLQVRLGQLVTLLRGDHLWYLGGPFANALAPWLAAALVVGGLMAVGWTRKRRGGAVLLAVLTFLLLLVVQSTFTVSALFVTHYAILQPFLLLLVALSANAILAAAASRNARQAEGTEPASATRRPLGNVALSALVLAALVAWGLAGGQADLRYHRALARTGGHAAHSDATSRLAAWLQQQGAAQPLALDWGIEAPVAYLTRNQVQPLELFGYERLDAADPGYADRLAPFVGEPGRLYLLHTPEDTVFQGRREGLEELAASRGLAAVEAATFAERGGRPLLLVLRLEPQ